MELSEEAIAQLNEKINIIRNNIGIEQKVSITYFIPDAKKAGGSYVTYSGIVKKVDEYLNHDGSNGHSNRTDK